MKFNVWIKNDKALLHTVESEVAKYGKVFAVGIANGWHNIFGDLPQQYLENLETYQEDYGLLVTRGTATPDIIRGVRGAGQ